MHENIERLKLILNLMPSAIMVVKPDLSIQFWNEFIAQKTRIPAHYAINRPLTMIYPAFTDYIDLVERALESHEAQTSHNARIIVEESDLHKLYSITAYPLSVGGQTEVAIKIDDITQQAKSKFDVAQIEKLASIGASVAGVAHEINNPLSVILQATQNVQRRLDPEFNANQTAADNLDLDLAQMHKYLAQRDILKFITNIQQETERASAIVKNMLEFVRRPQARMVTCNIIDVIDDGIKLAETEANLQDDLDFKDIAIVKNYPNSPVMVECNKQEIEQVIVNIIRNAVQALAAKPSDKEIKINVQIAQQKLLIEISDNGAGIAEHIKNKIFQPFFSTKPYGTGLGLSICRNIIVQHHQGDITLESTPGNTKFIINLSLRQSSIH